jgi:hypothetical protein
MKRSILPENYAPFRRYPRAARSLGLQNEKGSGGLRQSLSLTLNGLD